VVTIQERGRASEAVADPEVLQLAISEDRAVLTLNRRDFIRLHNQDSEHAGVIVCTVDPDFTGQARRIHDAIQPIPDLHGQLIRVNRPSS
jgi:predicted nuclease of predicted toxin-antitoxin system